MNTPEFSPEPEKEPSLVEQINYPETPEMKTIREQLVEAHRAGDETSISDLALQYRDLAEPINDADHSEITRCRYLLLRALIYLDAGKIPDCIAELNDIEDMTYGSTKLKELSPLIDRLRKQIKTQTE